MAQAGPVSTSGGRFPALPKYEIQEELGHGGMATVYRAHDARLGRDVAIKVLHPHLRDNREIAHRFATEAKAVAKLRHSNIVEVFDVSEAGDGERYLVQELIRGTTLRRILEERGPLPPEIAAAIAMEILGALSHAHAEGVIHRDVKPENVLLEHPHLRRKESTDSLIPRSNPNDMQLRIKLTDFGIAKMLDAQGVTSTGQVLGSPAHMAPEQIEGGDVDARADVFGVGVLLYECMVGHLPFEGTNPAQVLRRVLDGTYNPAERDRPIVGRDWSRILDRALMLDPKLRYESTQEMREAMLAYMKTIGVDDPRADMESYFRDPAAYETAHTEKLVARLRELGAEARKRRDVQAAANAYNRALAYAPNDAQILRIVRTLARAEERKKMVRRVAPPLLLIVVLGLAAFGVTRWVTVEQQKVVEVSGRPTASVTTTPKASASAVLATISSVAPRATSAARVVAVPQVSASAKKEPKRRMITIATVQPPAGVRGAVDGDSLGDTEITAGYTIPLNEDAHELTFSCLNDMCTPQTKKIEASDRNENVPVVLKIRDAVLIVDGPQAGSYGIREHPEIALRAGIPARVPMAAGADNITVVERGSGKNVPVSIRAGAEAHADFTQLAAVAP